MEERMPERVPLAAKVSLAGEVLPTWSMRAAEVAVSVEGLFQLG